MRMLKDIKTTTVKPLMNVGALLDIPTGAIVTGKKGESIINGGLSNIEGFAGYGNNFKSTIMHHMMYTAADRMACSIPDLIEMHTYDTEDNMLLAVDRYNALVNKHTKCLERDPIDVGQWTIASKSDYTADKWVKEILYPYVNEKEENKKGIVEFECFMDRRTKQPLKLPYPSFIEIDSLTEFEPETTIDAFEKLDDEKTNTLFMKQGLFKTKVLKDLPRLSNRANIYFLMTTHLGKKIDMSSNPYAKPTKDLQYMKQDEKIKGATDKVMFLTTHYWKPHGVSALINQSTKQPEYPLYDTDNSTDLNVVKMLMYRSKSGPSGFIVELVVSQNEGVLPALTEFHYIKSNKFGLDGSLRSYWLYLYPDVKLSRTTVRKKLEEDEKLARAVNITAELLQLKTFKPQLNDIWCDPKTLYEDLKEQGYDWDILLNTRGWWTIKQYSPNVKPFLSTVDLLKMRKGLYVPYWMDEKTKKPKKEYAKWFEKNK